MGKLFNAIVMGAFLAVGARAVADTPWLTLPPTPTLPKPAQSGLVTVNGVPIWYAEFGAGEPVLLLHGGFANSDYWGLQVPELVRHHYRVIVMDSRGHGRSGRDARPLGYDLMADDVLGLLDHLKVKRVALVGWSDGAIIGLDIAIHHPDRLISLFAFAANSDPSGVIAGPNKVFDAYLARAAGEYAKLSRTPDQYRVFAEQLEKMWATQPNFTESDLRSIRVPTWIVDADHDEAIKRENTEFMATLIPDSGLLLEPAVSHFAFIQAPEHFTADVLDFLKRTKGRR